MRMISENVDRAIKRFIFLALENSHTQNVSHSLHELKDEQNHQVCLNDHTLMRGTQSRERGERESGWRSKDERGEERERHQKEERLVMKSNLTFDEPQMISLRIL